MDNTSNEAQQQQQFHHQYHRSQSHDLSTAALYQSCDAYYAHRQHYEPDPSSAYHTHYYSSAAVGYHPPHLPPASASAAHLDPAATTAVASQIQHRHAATGAHGYVQPHEQPESRYQLLAGLNPTASVAVARLSQLTQFPDNRVTADRAMPGTQDGQWPPHDMIPPQQPGVRSGVGARFNHRGGKRGRGPFRGSGRGNYGRHPPRHHGGPPLRGRGRGQITRGGGRKFRQSAPDRQLNDMGTVSATGSSLDPESQLGPVQVLLPATAVAPVPAPMLPRRSPFPLVWCDICRVECNSLDILEQHKNGKRHKKTLQRMQEIEAQQKKLMVDVQGSAAANHEITPKKAEEENVPLVSEARNSLDEGKKVSAGIANFSSAVSSDQTGDTFIGVTVPVNMASVTHPVQVSEANKDSATTGSNTSAQVNEANKNSATPLNLPTSTLEIEHNIESQVQGQIVAGKAESLKEEVGDEAASTVAPAVERQKRRLRSDGYENYDKRHGPKWKLMKPGRGGKRLRTFEPVQSRPPERQRERPRVCTLCNVMCDTQAVFECHLSGKKHITRIKRFQGHDTVFGPVTVYIPPNQPVACPTKVPEPLFYGLTSREMLQPEAYPLNGLQVERLQQSDQAAEIREAEDTTMESQSEQAMQDPENKVPANDGEEPANKHAEELFTGSMSQEGNQLPAVLASGTSAEADTAAAIAEDVVVSADGMPLDNVVLPGLDLKEEPSTKDEALGASAEISQ